jgi:hypothetical protein
VTATETAPEEATPDSLGDVAPPQDAARRTAADWAVLAIVAVDVVAGVVYRFHTTSKMWLDEVQTVNISSQPLRQIPAALRRDGAPPLYYALLHFWMGIAGTSDAAIRALPGVLSLVTLPIMWFVVRRWFGRIEALCALGLLAASPFAVYFATENRMYSLVMLLVTAGIWAVMALFDAPTWPRAAAVAVIGALLLYTHYWSLYLLGVVGLWFVFVAVRERGPRQRAARLGIAGLVASGIAFLPWVPIFLYQSKHTGTPWAAPATLADAYGWIAGFTVNQSVQQVVTSLHTELSLLMLIVLLVLGFAAAPAGGDRIELRLTGQPRARVLAFVMVGTLGVGWAASLVANSAFQPRYSSVIFPIVVILMALGLAALPNRWLLVGVLAAASALSLWTVHWGAQVQRSQAGVVATVMHQTVPPGSVVAVCPDQLGPSLLRYAGASQYEFHGYPRYAAPDLVDWIDYKDAVAAAGANAFARRIVTAAGPEPFYLVWAKGYGLLTRCEDLAEALAQQSQRVPRTVVVAKKLGYYQSMNLVEYPPAP